MKSMLTMENKIIQPSLTQLTNTID